jgi:protein phosphatase
MALADLLTAITTSPGPKPRDDELDLFGLTHPGKVRRENQDHFLLGTIHQQVVVHVTSLPDADHLPLRGERLGTILLVADGVGGGRAGRDASRLAVETITRYVTTAMRCYHVSGRAAEKEFYEALRTAALEAHAAVLAEAAGRPEAKGMATTLTVALGVWPWMYVVQVGDSRCYYYLDGVLRQVTRDQTLAQNLADQGVLPADRVALSPFNSVLASAIGGGEGAAPEVTRFDLTNRGCVILLCSDGLTKHVTDPEIATQIGAMESSEQLCRTLVDLALERGGSDNITVIAGRAPEKSGRAGA